MTKTYGYEGVFIDLENDRGSQGMILKWCLSSKHLFLFAFPSLPSFSFSFRSVFALFLRQVHIDPQQTYVHSTNNFTEPLPVSYSWLPDSVYTSVERSIFFFFFSSTSQLSYYFSFEFAFSLNKHEVDHMWLFAGWCRRGSICKRHERVYSSLFYPFSFPFRCPDVGTNNL